MSSPSVRCSASLNKRQASSSGPVVAGVRLGSSDSKEWAGLEMGVPRLNLPACVSVGDYTGPQAPRLVVAKPTNAGLSL